MIDRQALLSDLQKLLQRLEADLLARSESAEVPEVGRRLREEYERAKKAQRTAQNYEDWRSDAITQAAAAWVLSCVFVRFLEDNRLIDPPKIAGPGKRLQQARDEWELYLGAARQPNERDYLLAVFDELAGLPGTKEVFGPHNPIRELSNWLSGDGARDMLGFFQKIDANSAESNKLIYDFTDPTWETRFLGDLYQDMSEAARDRYALLQTPEFVEEFILDRTLDPAIETFGLDGFRMIDPACGSGHFLLGSFFRVLGHWRKREPGAKVRDLVQRTLDSIHGVDLNPYAVAIARFRLLLVALKACEVVRLADAPAFHFNLVCGDSLLHAALRGGQQVFDYELTHAETEYDHTYASEDLPELKRMLKPGLYHAVVANPPYKDIKDRAIKDAYRARFATCHGRFVATVPFMERIFGLTVPSGYTGQITGNNFMKREFGKKLIEEFIPTIELTHIIDTSGAYIPGHGTPTVVLFGRTRPPVTKTIRTVMGIRGEPSTPDDPAHGLVWSAIEAQIDQPGSQSEFVSVADSQRDLFHKHPWSVGGGGAAELKDFLDSQSSKRLSEVTSVVGVFGMTNADEMFQVPVKVLQRHRIEREMHRRLILGDEVRDWGYLEGDHAVFPYLNGHLAKLEDFRCLYGWLWPGRTVLGNRATFAKLTYFEEGRPWWWAAPQNLIQVL
jgi:hypothetical protein